MTSTDEDPPDPTPLSLIVRRLIPALPEAVFTAWTDPAQLRRWWGPPGVMLVAAEIDLRIGGRFRYANRFPDGAVLWITGVFETIDRPTRLVYTWAHEPISETTEHTRVTVRFEQRDNGTEVIVLHEGFRSKDSEDSNEIGWVECLKALETVIGVIAPP